LIGAGNKIKSPTPFFDVFGTGTVCRTSSEVITSLIISHLMCPLKKVG